MSNGDLQYEDELRNIRSFRGNVFKLDTILFLLLGAGLVVSYIIPVIAPVLGAFAFFYVYKKLEYAAHYPCPRCGEPFGTKSKLTLNVGTQYCQNCGLNLYPSSEDN